MARVIGEGTIVQMEKDKPKSKCRKWQLRVPVGLDPRTGKYRQKTRIVKDMSYTQAKAALRTFIEDIEGNHVQGHTDWTFESYCQHYIEGREIRGEIAHSTARRQRSQLNALCRHIGKVKLEKVTTVMINEAYAAMMKGDTLTGKPSCGSYVNDIAVTAYRVFEVAISEGLIAYNPCKDDMPPKRDFRPREAIKSDQAREFVESLDASKADECAFLLAITLGLRRGEICGLTWSDVDWYEHTISIKHSFDKYKELKSTKTKAGLRVLPLPDVTYDGLLKWKEAQELKFASINKSRWYDQRMKNPVFLQQTEETPIMTNHHGERLSPDTLGYWWMRDRGRYGLEKFTLHQLRHTYLSLLAESGVHPKVMQELAGHASAQITMDIYTHVNMREKKAAAESVSQFF